MLPASDLSYCGALESQLRAPPSPVYWTGACRLFARQEDRGTIEDSAARRAFRAPTPGPGTDDEADRGNHDGEVGAARRGGRDRSASSVHGHAWSREAALH